ncbi:hypothetical protein PoB_007253200 [Plakobranchus ocellatus]|uniref:Secreted protein n=1 Tax=Plakobranchus ocellatus TaxID=259542 RepID=A0AAV4DPI7_9GAST|nr:hypothetical protein PoB_007253200 [Plakobranchus ocellatus]
MMICRVALEWNRMSGLIPLSWMTLGCLFHLRRSAENSESLHKANNLFLYVVMLAALPQQDFISPSDVNTSAFAFRWTGRHSVLNKCKSA